MGGAVVPRCRTPEPPAGAAAAEPRGARGGWRPCPGCARTAAPSPAAPSPAAPVMPGAPTQPSPSHLPLAPGTPRAAAATSPNPIHGSGVGAPPDHPPEHPPDPPMGEAVPEPLLLGSVPVCARCPGRCRHAVHVAEAVPRSQPPTPSLLPLCPQTLPSPWRGCAGHGQGTAMGGPSRSTATLKCWAGGCAAAPSCAPRALGARHGPTARHGGDAAGRWGGSQPPLAACLLQIRPSPPL